MGAPGRVGAAADFAADHQGPQAPFRVIVVRGHGGLGHMRRRAKPWGLGFLGFLSPGVLSLGGPWPAFGLMAGIRGDPPNLALPSSRLSLRCNWVMTACCRAMRGSKASPDGGSQVKTGIHASGLP